MTRRAKLLVVEDDAAIRQLLGDRLAQFELAFATCQAEAFELLQGSQFDLVLLDLRLPRKPNDMLQDNQVGIDILKTIRRRSLTKRDSGMLLPVVVMTAFGSEKLPAEVLIDHGANDYIKKPFGTEDDLERKLERALAGEGALMPAASTMHVGVRLAFDDSTRTVLVETLAYQGRIYDVLDALRQRHVEDRNEFLLHENYRYIAGPQLAFSLGISDDALSRRIMKFRDAVTRGFRDRLGRAVGRNDVIENPGSRGYRLNPRTIVLVAWGQISASRE